MDTHQIDTEAKAKEPTKNQRSRQEKLKVRETALLRLEKKDKKYCIACQR